MLQNHKVSLSGASACTYPHLLIHGYLRSVFIGSCFRSAFLKLSLTFQKIWKIRIYDFLCAHETLEQIQPATRVLDKTRPHPEALQQILFMLLLMTSNGQNLVFPLTDISSTAQSVFIEVSVMI